MPIITYPYNSFPYALATAMPTILGEFSGYFSDIIHIFTYTAAQISIFLHLRVCDFVRTCKMRSYSA